MTLERNEFNKRRRIVSIPRTAVAAVVEMCMGVPNIHEPARQAVKYLSPKLIVKATRRRKPDRREQSQTILLTYGKPNYAEREFIELCQKAGEPFPVKKIQVKWYSKKKK